MYQKRQNSLGFFQKRRVKKVVLEAVKITKVIIEDVSILGVSKQEILLLINPMGYSRDSSLTHQKINKRSGDCCDIS